LRALGDQQCNGAIECVGVGPDVEGLFAARESSIDGAENDLPEHEDSLPETFQCV